MDYFPLFVKLIEQPCLVVGGGEIALRKVRLLLQAGAKVTVLAPDLVSELTSLSQVGQIQHVARCFEPNDVTAFRLVIAATDIESVNQAVSSAANAQGVWVNVVDSPALSSYITPAIIDRSPLVIAVSTGGSVPVLARLIRTKLEALIPNQFGRLAQFAAAYRERVKARFTDTQKRRVFWEEILQSPIADAVMSGQDAQAHLAMQQQLQRPDQPLGAVYLVGAGPGNPDLLTFRALRLMQQADVVLYDRLVSPDILDLVRRDAERIYVGKAKKDHVMPQTEINQLLISLAQSGKRVLRLKGGDPFTFGRGGEEIEQLASLGILFEVVPGITSASGAAAYAGIPLTHRDYAQSVIFVTGHSKNHTVDLNWTQLAQPQQTVVIYMGLEMAGEICQQLMAHGLPASHPVAAVESATCAGQRRVLASLGDLAEKLQAESIASPCLIIVGEVVNLATTLTWFGSDA